MASDFDMEQMRQLLVSLSDRLAVTKGDEQVVEKLKVVERAINDLKKKTENLDRQNKRDSKNAANDFAKEFVEKLERSGLFDKVVDAIEEQGKLDTPKTPLNLPGFELGSKFSAGVGTFVKGLGSLGGALGSLTGTVLGARKSLDGSVTGIVKTFGGANSALLMGIAGITDERIDAYRTILGTAEGTITSMKQMSDAALTAGMDVESFGKAVARGGTGTRLRGAESFAAVYGTIKQVIAPLGSYGYSLKQIQEATNIQNDILKNQGNVFRYSNKDLVTSLDELLKVNVRAANILGKTRDENLKALEAASRDPAFNTFLNGLENVNAGLVNRVQANLDSISPALKDIFQDQFTLDGAVRGDAAQTFALLPPEVQNLLTGLASDLKSGQIKTDKEAEDRWTQLKPLMEQFLKGQTAQTYGILARLNGGAFEAAAGINIGARNLNLEQRGKSDEEILGAGTPQDAFLLGIENSSERLRGVVDGVISNVFDPLLNAVGPKLQQLGTTIDKLIESMTGMLKQTQGFSNAIMIAAGLIGGGILLSKTAGLVSMIIGRQFLPLLGKVLQTVASPLIRAAGMGATAIGALTSSGFITKIATAISGAVGTTLGNVLNGSSAAGGAGLGLAARAGLGALGAATLVYNMPDQVSTDNLPTTQEDYNRRIEDKFKDPNSADAIANRIGDPRSWLFNALGIDDVRTDDLTNKQYRVNADGTRSYLNPENDQSISTKQLTEAITDANEKGDRVGTKIVEPNSPEASEINAAIDDYIKKNPEILMPNDQLFSPTPKFDESNFDDRFGETTPTPDVLDEASTPNNMNERLLQTMKELLMLQREVGMSNHAQLTELIRLQEDVVRATRFRNS